MSVRMALYVHVFGKHLALHRPCCHRFEISVTKSWDPCKEVATHVKQVNVTWEQNREESLEQIAFPSGSVLIKTWDWNRCTTVSDKCRQAWCWNHLLTAVLVSLYAFSLSSIEQLSFITSRPYFVKPQTRLSVCATRLVFMDLTFGYEALSSSKISLWLSKSTLLYGFPKIQSSQLSSKSSPSLSLIAEFPQIKCLQPQALCNLQFLLCVSDEAEIEEGLNNENFIDSVLKTNFHLALFITSFCLHGECTALGENERHILGFDYHKDW